MDQFHQFQDLLLTQAGTFHAPLQGVGLHKLLEVLKLLSMLLNERVVQIVLLDELVCHGVEQQQVTLPLQAVPVVGVHGSFGLSGVDDDDLMTGNLVLQHSAPENGVGNHRVGADENNGVGEFQILEGIAGSVKAIALLVGNNCGCHTKTCVAVHVGLQVVAHHMAKESKLFHSQLAGTDTSNAFLTVLGLNFLQLVCHMPETLIPGHFLKRTVRLPDLGQAVGLDGALLFIQRQAFDAAEAIVHRISGSGHHLDNPVILYIKIQIAVNSTIITGRLNFFHIHLLIICRNGFRSSRHIPS